MITALVGLLLFQKHIATTRHIDLATNNSLEVLLGYAIKLRLHLRQFGSLFSGRLLEAFNLLLQSLNLRLQILDLILAGTILLLDIVPELLDGKHITVVGDGYTTHTVGNSLIHQTRNTRLTIKQ